MMAFKSFQTDFISTHIWTAWLQEQRSRKCDMKIGLYWIVSLGSSIAIQISLCGTVKYLNALKLYSAGYLDHSLQILPCRYSQIQLTHALNHKLFSTNFRPRNMQVSKKWCKSFTDEFMPLSSVWRLLDWEKRRILHLKHALVCSIYIQCVDFSSL